MDAIDYQALVQDDRIHASLYTDPRIFDDEMERIFRLGWVFVGHESEIPDAVPGDRGSVRTFTCPYHGWTYDLSGELLGVPYPGGYASFDKRTHGLACAPRVSSYRGFVFASLSPTGPSLADHLGIATQPIDRSCELSPVGEVELTAGWVKHRCAANWKALPGNDSDGYHLGFVHRSLFATVRSQYARVVGRPARAHASWLELSRGLNREFVDAGRTVSHVTDEWSTRPSRCRTCPF